MSDATATPGNASTRRRGLPPQSEGFTRFNQTKVEDCWGSDYSKGLKEYQVGKLSKDWDIYGQYMQSIGGTVPEHEDVPSILITEAQTGKIESKDAHDGEAKSAA